MRSMHNDHNNNEDGAKDKENKKGGNMEKISNKFWTLILIVSLMLLLLPSVLGDSETIESEEHSDFEQAKAIISAQTSCNDLNDEQLEILGDYIMEQMHPGELHEIMDERMGGEGSESLRLVHIRMAQTHYCGSYYNNDNYTNFNMMRGMMGMGGYGMIGMMGYNQGNMMGYNNYNNNYNGYGGMGNMMFGNYMGFGFGWMIFMWLFWIAVFVGIIALIVWLILTLINQTNNKNKRTKRRR